MMADMGKVLELIDKTEEIKNCFSEVSERVSRGYSFSERRAKNIYSTRKVIYNNPIFLKWRAELEYELDKICQDQLIRDIQKLFKGFSGMTDDRVFTQLEIKLGILREHLSDYYNEKEGEIDDLRIPEKELEEKILGVLCRLQKNSHYSATDNEDIMNDYVRDMLSCSYEVADQTRQGKSQRESNSGEIDIQIRCKGLPVVMIEGLKLASLDKKNLNEHVDKVLTNYDPNGCPYAIVIIYSTIKRFNEFYNRLFKYLGTYEFPYPRKSDLINVDTIYSELKHAQIILNRNNHGILVHFFVLHIN